MKGKISDKKLKQVKVLIIVVILLLIVWFLIISPLIKFKNMEKQVMEAGKRYFEINNSLLPTGKKIRTATLQKLYDKGLIENDLKSPYFSKMCDSKESWVKVKKDNKEYKYYVYLKCGILSSKIDHKGPEITLNGQDIITLTKGEKYKDAGVKSVVDDTDGNINPKNVKIDTSKVNTNKNGTYEVTYKIRDSFNNETIKVRTVKVEQILDKVVEKETDESNVYKGRNENNYIKLDGITFKIVGLNTDGTVKVTTSEPLAFVDYNSIDTWLNDYFYEKLSDDAKKLIQKSKWCNENIENIEGYTECNSYSKKKMVGSLSVDDINNSKDKNGNSNLVQQLHYWTSNTKGSNAIKQGSYEVKYEETKKSKISGVRPTVNLIKGIVISTGNGTDDDPYIIEGNNKTLKAGENISDARTGEYIKYSGYIWRIIGKESDGTTKIIMSDVITKENQVVTMEFDKKTSFYNTKNKNNIGYKIVNKVSEYVNTKSLAKQTIEVYSYKNNASYQNKKISTKSYKAKIAEVSMFDLYSASSGYNHWLRESTKMGFAYTTSSMGDVIENIMIENNNSAIKLTANLDKNISVKTGKGTIASPYTISK